MAEGSVVCCCFVWGEGGVLKSCFCSCWGGGCKSLPVLSVVERGPDLVVNSSVAEDGQIWSSTARVSPNTVHNWSNSARFCQHNPNLLDSTHLRPKAIRSNQAHRNLVELSTKLAEPTKCCLTLPPKWVERKPTLDGHIATWSNSSQNWLSRPNVA